MPNPWSRTALSVDPARRDALIRSFSDAFGTRDDLVFFSAPGRTEIGGNHTDHNGGFVLAGSIDRDILAAAAPADGTVCRIHAAGFRRIEVDLNDLSFHPNESGTSTALVRGVAASLSRRGIRPKPFSACTHSRVMRGSGVSSSAAFEVLVCALFLHFAGASLPPAEIAAIGAEAESLYFQKPCGRMDQCACAAGGLLLMDFADLRDPALHPVRADFSSFGYSIVLVNVGKGHADLTPLYAAVGDDMRRVAALFDKPYLGAVSPDDFYDRLPAFRRKAGDRAVLRAMHFFEESRRAREEKDALEQGDFPRFLSLVRESGHSSFEALQNVLLPMPDAAQDTAVALTLAAHLLADTGAWRVHGGGFGGTIQCFVPETDVSAFCKEMDALCGNGACFPVNIRPQGVVQID